MRKPDVEVNYNVINEKLYEIINLIKKVKKTMQNINDTENGLKMKLKISIKYFQNLAKKQKGVRKAVRLVKCLYYN